MRWEVLSNASMRQSTVRLCGNATARTRTLWKLLLKRFVVIDDKFQGAGGFWKILAPQKQTPFYASPSSHSLVIWPLTVSPAWRWPTRGGVLQQLCLEQGCQAWLQLGRLHCLSAVVWLQAPTPTRVRIHLAWLISKTFKTVSLKRLEEEKVWIEVLRCRKLTTPSIPAARREQCPYRSPHPPPWAQTLIYTHLQFCAPPMSSSA